MVAPQDLMHPGPINNTVLYNQSAHRSDRIWVTGDATVLTCKRVDGWIPNNLDIRVQKYLLRAGFYGIYHLGHLQLDRSLITALVERWRPETHTFHMPQGETTITLQDVEILGGIRVDGYPITGYDKDSSPHEWMAMIENLLGIRPEESHIRGNRLQMKWLYDNFHKLDANADDLEVIRYTRAIILMLLGGHFLSDKSGSLVKLMYLSYLADLSTCAKYSWGSAILATLYREMCVASKADNNQIGGPLILLQIWAWTRFTHIRPFDQLAPYPKVAASDLPVFPYGYRWSQTSRTYKVPHHNLLYYREQLEIMGEDQIIWEPYADVIDTLPSYCCSDCAIWRARVPLICYAVVEYHYPERVLRQFGLKQNIPIDCIRDDKLHLMSRQGRPNTKWDEFHKVHIETWNNMHNTIQEIDSFHGQMSPNDPYMIWYRSITRLSVCSIVPSHGILPSAASHRLMLETLARAYMMAVQRHDQELIDIIGPTLQVVKFDVRGLDNIPPIPNLTQNEPQRGQRGKRRRGEQRGGRRGKRSG